MESTPQFRSDLYQGTARCYDRYRVPYTAVLIDDLAIRAALSGTGRLLPSLRAIERRALSPLTKAERLQLLDLLAKVLESLASIAAEPPQPLTGKRARPARLNRPDDSTSALRDGAASKTHLTPGASGQTTPRRNRQ